MEVIKIQAAERPSVGQPTRDRRNGADIISQGRARINYVPTQMGCSKPLISFENHSSKIIVMFGRL